MSPTLDNPERVQNNLIDSHAGNWVAGTWTGLTGSNTQQYPAVGHYSGVSNHFLYLLIFIIKLYYILLYFFKFFLVSIGSSRSDTIRLTVRTIRQSIW